MHDQTPATDNTPTRGRGRPKIEDNHPEIVALLGTMTDAALAERFECSPITIFNCRSRHDVDRYRKGSGAPEGEHGQEEAEPPSPYPAGLFVVVSQVESDGTAILVNSHRGVRVYSPETLDPRVTSGMDGPLQVFTTWSEVEAHHRDGRKPCGLALEEAAKLFPSTRWAEFF